MVTITNAHVRSNIYETLYDLINTDKSGYWTSTTYLFGGFPDTADFKFPCIIMEGVKIGNKGEFTVDTTRSVATGEYNIVIYCFGKSNKSVEYLADGVDNTITNNTFPGTYLIGVSEGDAMMEVAGQKIKGTSLTFSFKRRN